MKLRTSSKSFFIEKFKLILVIERNLKLTKTIASIGILAIFLTISIKYASSQSVSQMQITVAAVSRAPTVGTITVAPGTVNLISGGFIKVTGTTALRDRDGGTDITSCVGYLYNSTTYAFNPTNARYTNSSCYISSCSGQRCDCECSLKIRYFDAPGTWNFVINATDTTNRFGYANQTLVVEKLIAIDLPLPYAPITFPAEINIGDNNVPAVNNPLKINNTGNVKMQIYINGTNFVGVEDSTKSFSISNLIYNSTATGLTNARSVTNAQASFTPTGGVPVNPSSVAGISEPATLYIYHYLSIPLGIDSLNYTSTYQVEVIEQP